MKERKTTNLWERVSGVPGSRTRITQWLVMIFPQRGIELARCGDTSSDL